MEAFYRPNFILYKDDVSLHSKDSKSESFETTFTESKDTVMDGVSAENCLDSAQGEKDVKIQTVSYEVEDEQGPEYEVRVPSRAKCVKALCRVLIVEISVSDVPGLHKQDLLHL